MAKVFSRRCNALEPQQPAPCGLEGPAAEESLYRLSSACGAMIKGELNYSPEVMVIDEICGAEEVEAARACKKRGVRVIASARGNLRQIVESTHLKGLVCHSETVAFGDEAAKADAKRRDASSGPMNTHTAQGGSEPMFDVVVELRGGELNEWRIVMSSADAVGRILDGGDYLVQKRSRDPITGELFLEFQKECFNCK